MKMSFKVIFLTALVHASVLVDASSLRHTTNSLSASFLPDTEDTMIRIPLKKREISAEEVSTFYEFISISEKTLEHSKISSHKSEAKVEKSQNSESVNKPAKDVSLKYYSNGQYIGLVSIADSDNEFEVIFDTGSANMWINSRDCQQDTCTSHKQYDYEQSKTFIELGQPLEVYFGSGTLIGEINADNIWVGGLKIENQSFAMIQQESGVLSQSPHIDGIVGLAYPSMAAYDLNPIFDNIIEEKKLSRNMFSFYLDPKDKTGQGSHLMLGGVDKSLVDSDILFFPVVDKRYWAIEATAILLDGKDVGLCNGGCRLIIDSGTSLITNPNNDYDNLMSYFPRATDCATEKLPDITFVLKNGYKDPFDQTEGQKVEYTISDEDYMVSFRMFGRHGRCNPGFMPLDIPEPHGPAWILGDIFLSKFVSIYDRDNDLVGFAQAKSR